MTIEHTELNQFIDARLSQLRLVSESATSSVPSSKAEEEAQKVEIKTESSSAFTVGLNDLENPSSIQIELQYTVALVIQSTGMQLVNYSTQHAATFDVMKWAGIADWSNVPDGLFDLYFAMINQHATQRAEETLLAMGFRGIQIPRLKSFSNPEPKEGQS